MNRFVYRFVFLAAAFVFFALNASAFAQSRTITDAVGRKVMITDTSRIVSIGGAVTEVLYALGLADKIVAVDSTSTFPEATKQKANVGYMRALAPEGVLALGEQTVDRAADDERDHHRRHQLDEAEAARMSASRSVRHVDAPAPRHRHSSGQLAVVQVLKLVNSARERMPPTSGATLSERTLRKHTGAPPAPGIGLSIRQRVRIMPTPGISR